MRFIASTALFALSASSALAALSTEQKVQDFQQLAALFAKQYAPYEWKRDVVKFDLFELAPWLERVRNSKDDLEYYQISTEYIASLNDVHSEYYIPSNFVARLGIAIDYYDDKPLIESIDRTLLSTDDFPFEKGDELVSVDGRRVDDIVKEYSKYVAFGNPRSTRRWAALFVTSRYQDTIARAAELGDTAVIVVRRDKTGNLETYTIPWDKHGRPLISEGPVPTPRGGNPSTRAAKPNAARESVFTRPSYRDFLIRIQSNVRLGHRYLRGFGAPTPSFAMPAGFVQHRNSWYYSGTFPSGKYKIGYIRIGDFEPAAFEDLDFVAAQFDKEIAFFQANTDGLVVDVMRNPGGFGCYAESLITRLVPYTFETFGLMMRPTLADVVSIGDEVQAAIDDDADNHTIELLQSYQWQIESAFSENRGLTGRLPACDVGFQREPVTDDAGQVSAYNKPLILLTDEFTTSAGDIFASIIQDARRGPLVGYRTSGAGGSVNAFQTGFYSEGTASVTQTLVVRPKQVVTSDFPAAQLIENIGVRPDVEIDYMTKENLLNNGKPFVQAFTDAIVAEITKAAK